jgi:hypothetical protein
VCKWCKRVAWKSSKIDTIACPATDERNWVFAAPPPSTIARAGLKLSIMPRLERHSTMSPGAAFDNRT